VQPSERQRILRALPSNTESMIVLGPYIPKRVTPSEPTEYQGREPVYAQDSPHVTTLGTHWEVYRCNRVLFEYERRLGAYCATHAIEVSVFAFRTIRTIVDIPGGTEVEGCQIILFRDEIADDIRNLFHNTPLRIAGVPVIDATNQTVQLPSGAPQPVIMRPPGVPESAIKNERPRSYIASPSSRMLVAATTQALLNQVLTALANPSPPDNALRIPQHLLSSQLWAFRRFGPEFARDGTAVVTRQDPQAKCLELAYGPSDGLVRVRYVSANPQSAATLRRLFTLRYESPPLPRRIDKETVELTIPDPVRNWAFVLCLLGMLVMP
jgi:hypothetical protein